MRVRPPPVGPAPTLSGMEPILWHVGYQRTRSPADLASQLSTAGITLVLDVRRRPRSQRPGYDRAGLEQEITAAGLRYASVPALGAADHLADRWQADHEGAIAALGEHLEQTAAPTLDRLVEVLAIERVVVMCMCPSLDRCHRRAVLERVSARLPNLRIEAFPLA